MAIYGYARGQNLEGQQRRIGAYATAQGLMLDSIIVEGRGVTGVTPFEARPAGGPLLARLIDGDAVIVVMLDRIFRSALDAIRVVADLELRGVRLHILDLGGDMALDGRSERLVTIAEAFGRGEREQVSEGMTARNADRKSRGLYLGGKIPFGFRTDAGKLVRHEGEQKAIREIIALRAAGKPLRAIAAAMLARGHKISHEGVAAVLRAHHDQGTPLPEGGLGGDMAALDRTGDQAQAVRDIHNEALA